MVKKEDKRGWLRIVEASLAVMMVLSSLLIINNNIRQKQEIALDESFYSLLQKIAENSTLRGGILSYNYSNPSNAAGNYQIINNINQFIAGEIKDKEINYSISICSPNEPCNLETNISGEVYSVERIITTNLTNPEIKEKKMKIYWGNT